MSVSLAVPGQWGEWSDWTPCNAKCGRGVRKRTRECDSPAPVNGGPACDGAPVQKKGCNVVCPSVDGKWSSWSSWSSCSADCIQYRRRDCNSPAPKNGGRYCAGGRDLATQPCSDGICKGESDERKRLVERTSSKTRAFLFVAAGLNSIVLYGTETVTHRSPTHPPRAPSGGASTTDLTLCVGLIVAFLVFVTVVLVIIRLLRRKSDHHLGGHHGGSGEIQFRRLLPTARSALLRSSLVIFGRAFGSADKKATRPPDRRQTDGGHFSFLPA